MHYLVHFYRNGNTLSRNEYETIEKAFEDYNSSKLSDSGQCQKAMYIVVDGLFFEYVGKAYIPPQKWDGVERRDPQLQLV